jgi:cytoskeleton protein RodZ
MPPQAQAGAAADKDATPASAGTVADAESPSVATAAAVTPAPVTATPVTAALEAAVAPSPVTAAPAAASPHDNAETQAPAATKLAASSQPQTVNHHIVLRATGDTWVQVRQTGGPALLSRLMKQGETWPVPDEPNLLLDTGNANALIIEVDGVPTRLTGAKGIVIHNVPLDADMLGSGMTVRLGH